MKYNLTKEDLIARGVLAADRNGKRIQIINNSGIHWIDANSESANGYVKFGWMYNGKHYTVRAHKVNWLFNVGNVPNGFELDHLDGDKTNNDLDNLQLVTASQNCQKAVRQRNIKRDHNVFSKKSDESLKLIYIRLLSNDVLTPDNKQKLKLITEELTRRNIL